MFEVITENIFFKAALAITAVFCVMTLFSANAEREELIAERDRLEALISDYNEEILSLENDFSAPIDDEYIIRVARRKLNMRLPEEIVFITNVTSD